VAPEGEASDDERGGDEQDAFEAITQPELGTQFNRHHTVAKNVFNGVVIVGRDFVAGDGSNAMLPVTDVTAFARVMEETFVSPPEFPELVDALGSDCVVLAVGVASGKRTAGLMALHRAGHEPILELPGDLSARELVDCIHAVVEDADRPGILIDSVDSRTLTDVAGYGLRRLQAALVGRGAVVFTSVTENAAFTERLTGITLGPPAADQVIEAVLRRRGADQQARACALTALDQISLPVSPGLAASLADAAVRSPGTTPDDLAALFERRETDKLLRRWIDDGPSPQQVAALAAAAVLDGAPTADVDIAAETLGELFVGEARASATPAAPKIFRAVDNGWPPGVVERRRELFSTHFGRQPVEVIRLSAPHDRYRVVSFLWQTLGSDFRRPFLKWLAGLAEERRWVLRGAAAVTAGTLFVDESWVVERELLRQWVTSDDIRLHACAALALGVPLALGRDPTAARALAYSMGRSRDARLQSVAVMAYGSLLGIWDSNSAAPSHLWRIGMQNPQLQSRADAALTNLVASGADGARVRATVLTVVAGAGEAQASQDRVHRLVARFITKLTGRDAASRETLEALCGPDERASFQLLARLWAESFLSPRGRQSAGQALRALLRAVADGRIDRDVVFALIREMKRSLPGDTRLALLGRQLRRALRLEAAGRDGEVSEAARMTLFNFFAPEKGA
jgi:hypothetical protein